KVRHRKATHREADDVSALDAKLREHIVNVVASPCLGVPCWILGHVRGRVSARVECDAAEPARQKAHLRFRVYTAPADSGVATAWRYLQNSARRASVLAARPDEHASLAIVNQGYVEWISVGIGSLSDHR